MLITTAYMCITAINNKTSCAVSLFIQYVHRCVSSQSDKCQASIKPLKMVFIFYLYSIYEWKTKKKHMYITQNTQSDNIRTFVKHMLLFKKLTQNT